MKRFLCLAALAVSVGCQSAPRTPTEPDAVIPPPITLARFGGMWTGEYRVTATTLSFPFRVGTILPFTLRLEENGAVLRGNFQTDAVLIDVSGTINDDGVMSLQGSAPGLGSGDFVGTATLTRFSARVDSMTGLAGDLAYRLDRTAETRQGFTTLYAGDIVTAQRSTLPPPTFDGTWGGSFVVRSCTETCLPPHVNEVGSFRFSLQQSGGDVSGLIVFSLSDPGTPVSGRVEGDRLILFSPATDSRFRIVEWSTERDRFGRMVGAFTYEQRYDNFPSPHVVSRHVQLGTVSLIP